MKDDTNCFTLSNGECVGRDCMHDVKSKDMCVRLESVRVALPGFVANLIHEATVKVLPDLLKETENLDGLTHYLRVSIEIVPIKKPETE